MNTFGERIKALRTARGMSQKVAAGGIGISPGLLAQLEGGTNDNPTISTVRKVSEFYSVPMGLLIPSDASPPGVLNEMISEVVKALSPEEAAKVLDYIRFVGSTPKPEVRDPEVSEKEGEDHRTSSADPLTKPS